MFIFQAREWRKRWNFLNSTVKDKIERKRTMGEWFTVDAIDKDTFVISEYRHWEETDR